MSEDAPRSNAPTFGGLYMAFFTVLIVATLAFLGSIVVDFIRDPPRFGDYVGDESRCRGVLKSLVTTQELFLAGDKDGDEVRDYGSLRELRTADLIDDHLANGTRQGYLIQLATSPAASGPRWLAVANPAPNGEGERSYCINQEGQLFYTEQGPLELTPDCALPANCLPLR
jgi:hypothetical protein